MRGNDRTAPHGRAKNHGLFHQHAKFLVKPALTAAHAFQPRIQVNSSGGADGFGAVSTNGINSPAVLSSSWRIRLYTTTKTITPETPGGRTGYTR
jgi:hypothetical protein